MAHITWLTSRCYQAVPCLLTGVSLFQKNKEYVSIAKGGFMGKSFLNLDLNLIQEYPHALML